MCFYKVEIKATLTPPGIGSLLNSPDANGNVANLSFRQVYVENLWAGDSNGATLMDYVTTNTPNPWTNTNNNDGPLLVNINEQPIPVNDKLFLIDSPGHFIPTNTPWGFIGSGHNFGDLVYVDGTPCSPIGYWYALTKCCGPNLFAVSACNGAAGHITLPTTWGDPRWHQ